MSETQRELTGDELTSALIADLRMAYRCMCEKGEDVNRANQRLFQAEDDHRAASREYGEAQAALIRHLTIPAVEKKA